MSAGPILPPSTHLRGGGESVIMNCGYGHGGSVLEVVEVVKKVSGVDFEVRLAPAPGRRSGKPCGGKDRLRGARLGAAYDDLEEIVSQALRWERVLAERKAA